MDRNKLEKLYKTIEYALLADDMDIKQVYIVEALEIVKADLINRPEYKDILEDTDFN